jgi:aspartyl-tRNA(Asn)/glutamyl-tRNA(Gln) amidotransferase subunit A
MSSFLGDLPRLFPRPEQTIAGIGRLIRQRAVTCAGVLSACLEQVDEWEPKVHAWVALDRDGAMEQATVLDEELRAGKDRGPLHGIPMGIKDIINVKGLPTACGAKRWAGAIADKDADVVARLREAGSVIMGKTVTTPYAWIDPPPTRNPWNSERTPGGSSSGSAAAVACGMCYGAIGTQTGGSITRPASFCGVAGMKPMSMFISRGGVFPFAPSLDHVGPLARKVEDLRLIFGAIHEPWQALKERNADDSPLTAPPRLARFRGFFDRRAQTELRASFEESLESIASRGAVVVELDDPVDFEQVLKDHRLVMASEAAKLHSDWLEEFPDDYPPRITELILEGRAIRAADYLRAKDRQFQVSADVMEALMQHKARAAVTLATISTASDPSTTGDPAFNSPWSFSGLPTVSFPTSLAPDRMPVANQFVGYQLRDYDLLRTAEWGEDAIRTSRQ